jgi:hypothetical protein
VRIGDLSLEVAIGVDKLDSPIEDDCTRTGGTISIMSPIKRTQSCHQKVIPQETQSG